MISLLNNLDIIVTNITLAHKYCVTPGKTITLYENKRKIYGIMLALSGSVLYQINGNKTVVQKGDIVFLPSDISYKFSNPNDINQFHYTVNFNLSSESVKKLKEFNIIALDNLTVLKTSQFNRLELLFSEIVDCWTAKNIDYNLMCKHYIYEILAILFKELLLPINENYKYSVLIPAKDYIDKYYHKDISVDELSAICNLSTSHFSKLFREFFEIAPNSYIINTRLERAKALLLSQLYTVEEVANLVGFTDANYFSRLFKKHVGVSPSTFKYN